MDFFWQLDSGRTAARVTVMALITASLYTLDGQGPDTQRVAKAGGDGFKFIDTLGVGLFMDAVEAGNAKLLQVRSHGFIGGKHELFNQSVGPVALGGRNAFHEAMLIEFNYRLGQVKINGAAL